MKKSKNKQLDIDDLLHDEETVDMETGLISEGKLNEVKEIRTLRKNGTLRIQHDFSNCPSMAEQHTGHLTDINYLMAKYKPDEIAAFIAARSTRPEITGHDFSQELSFQDAHNVVYNARKLFFELTPEVRANWQSPLEFIKFIDNPANAEKMVKLGLIKPKQIENLTKTPTENAATMPAPTTPTQEKETGKAK